MGICCVLLSVWIEFPSSRGMLVDVLTLLTFKNISVPRMLLVYQIELGDCNPP